MIITSLSFTSTCTSSQNFYLHGFVRSFSLADYHTHSLQKGCKNTWAAACAPLGKHGFPRECPLTLTRSGWSVTFGQILTPGPIQPKKCPKSLVTTRREQKISQKIIHKKSLQKIIPKNHRKKSSQKIIPKNHPKNHIKITNKQILFLHPNLRQVGDLQFKFLWGLYFGHALVELDLVSRKESILFFFLGCFIMKYIWKCKSCININI